MSVLHRLTPPSAARLQVRALVAFVRKRDRRVAAQQRRLQERAAENARRAEEQRHQQRQQRLQQMADYTEAAWSRSDQQLLQVRDAPRLLTGGVSWTGNWRGPVLNPGEPC